MRVPAEDAFTAQDRGCTDAPISFAETRHLMDVCDLFVVENREGRVEFGPARRLGPGVARFLYLRDPAAIGVNLFRPRSYH